MSAQLDLFAGFAPAPAVSGLPPSYARTEPPGLPRLVLPPPDPRGHFTGPDPAEALHGLTLIDELPADLVVIGPAGWQAAMAARAELVTRRLRREDLTAREASVLTELQRLDVMAISIRRDDGAAILRAIDFEHTLDCRAGLAVLAQQET